MASPLNRLPNGLLDFFGIKSGGWGPRELGQVLTPTFDLLRWYLDGNATEVLATITGSAGANTWGAAAGNTFDIASTTPEDLCGLAGTAAVLEIPQTEIWYVVEADIRWTINDATGVFAASLGSGTFVAAGITPRRVWPMYQNGYQTGAAVARQGSASLASPQWVLPGHRISVFMYGSQVGAGTNTAAARFRIVRCRR